LDNKTLEIHKDSNNNFTTSITKTTTSTNNNNSNKKTSNNGNNSSNNKSKNEEEHKEVIKTPIKYVPLRYLLPKTTMDEEDFYSSCDELNSDTELNYSKEDKNDEEFNNHKRMESEKIKSIFKNKFALTDEDFKLKNVNENESDEDSDKSSDTDINLFGSSNSDSNNESKKRKYNDTNDNSNNENDSDNDNDDDEISKLLNTNANLRKKLNKNMDIYISYAMKNFIEKFDCLQEFVQHIKSKHKKSKFCFGCMWGNARDDPLDLNALNYCIKIIEQNYGHMANIALSKIVHNYFKDNIYDPMKADGKSVPLWRTRDILEHLEHHIINPVIHLVEKIRKYNKIITVLDNMYFKVKINNAHQEILEADAKNIKLSVMLEKEILNAFKTKPKDMLFYNENYQINVSDIGKYLNINKRYQIEK
jgi:hypothetical protein